jgi:hypothetical protein
MPVSYQVDYETGTIDTRCTGAVTLDEVMAHFRELEEHPSLPQPLNVLLDLDAVTSPPSSIQLKVVVASVAVLRSRVRWGRCAIVASRPDMFGMSRMFELLADDLFVSSCAFKTRAEAESWLETEP